MSEPITEPGIYTDLSWEDYRAIPAISQSVLKILGQPGGTPKHAYAAFRGDLDRDDSEALRLGRLEHLWIVEGEKEFRERTIIAPTYCEAEVKSKGVRCCNSPTVTDGKEWRCGVHGKGDEWQTPADYCTDADVQRIREMAEAVRLHPIQQHLARPGFSECVGVYEVPVKFGLRLCPSCGGYEHPREFQRLTNGGNLWCWRCRAQFEVPKVTGAEVTIRHKVRLDRLAGPHKGQPHLIVDLKRMQVMTGDREKREKTILKYQWHIQAAMYTEFVRLHFGVDLCWWAWVFVEERRPYDVTWLPASSDTLAVGADQLTRYRKLWAICQHTGIWPGYCNGNQPAGGLPKWYIDHYRKAFGDSDKTLQDEDQSLYGEMEDAA